MLTRKDYMDKKCTHQEYFAQFVTNAVRNAVLNGIGRESILESSDEHLNDIPLSHWDALVGYPGDNWPGYANWHCRLPIDRKLIKEAGEWVTASTLVCIAKEAARQIKEGK